MNLSLEYRIRKPKIVSENPPLLVLLHGYGSNEEDLFSFADELPGELLIISARAPHSMGFGGYAWYTIHWDAPEGRFSDIPEAIRAKNTIVKFIDEIKSAYNTNPKNTFLLGFSQGCILSLAVALDHPEKIQHVIGLSGYINKDLLPQDLEMREYSQLDIYSSHGTVDQVIPVEWARNTKPFLDNLGIDNVYYEYPVGHGVAPQNFYSFNQWIRERI